MKYFISFLLILIMLISASPIYAQASYGKFSDEAAELFYIESYYDSTWDNYNYHINHGLWPLLSTRSNHAYLSFVNDINNDWQLRLAINFAAGLVYRDNINETQSITTGLVTTKEKNIDILINLMALMDYELNKVMNHLVDVDVLKAIGEYTMDVAKIAVNILTLQTGTGVILDKVVLGANLTHKFSKNLIDSVDNYKRLNKMLKNYETYHGFLSAIVIYSNDTNLKNAAATLLDFVGKAMILKLEYFSNEIERYGIFVGKDIFFDEFIMNPNNWSVTDQPMVTIISGAYESVKQGLAMFDLMAGIAVFAGDMVIGISDMLTRITEMRTLSLIHEAIVKDMDDNKRNASRNNFEAINKAFRNMNYLMYINARGEYCLYNMVQQDSKLLSSMFNNRNDTEKWYQAVQSRYIYNTNQLFNFFPDIEHFRIKQMFGYIPSLEETGIQAYLSNSELNKLNELLNATDPMATMLSFDYTDDIDNLMFYSSIIAVGYDEHVPNMTLPESLNSLDETAMYRTELNRVHSILTGLYGRSMIDPENFRRYHEGHFYYDHWDLTHYDRPGFTITGVFDLSENLYKVVGTVGRHEYGEDNSLHNLSSFIAIVAKNSDAIHGYYLLAKGVF